MSNDLLKYLTTESRLKTFKNFPSIKGAPLCTPQNLADAGFYSTATRKVPDSVKCFACDKQLSNWEEDDDPWQEHLRRGQNCPYMQYKTPTTHSYHDTMKLILQLFRRNLGTISQDAKRRVEVHVESLRKKAFES